MKQLLLDIGNSSADRDSPRHETQSEPAWRNFADHSAKGDPAEPSRLTELKSLGGQGG